MLRDHIRESASKNLSEGKWPFIEKGRNAGKALGIESGLSIKAERKQREHDQKRMKKSEKNRREVLESARPKNGKRPTGDQGWGRRESPMNRHRKGKLRYLGGEILSAKNFWGNP